MGFLFFNLLNHPDKLLAAQREVDEVLGDNALEASHLPKLKYVKAAIFETLRYLGPISIFGKHAIEPTTLGGKYKVDPSNLIICSLKPFHHDRRAWGDDADEYKPERFLNGGYESLPPNSFKPFGDGERACIGRAFAEQEMIINVALILQRFQVEKADPNYTLRKNHAPAVVIITNEKCKDIKSALTIKPDEFKIRVRRRPGKGPMVGFTGADMAAKPSTTEHAKKTQGKEANGVESKAKLTVLYASQAGTCKAFAQDLQDNGPNYGFAVDVQILDSATENVPKDHPVVIITPSYEGRPAPNAKKFVSWLEANADSKLLDGVNYALFGAGNSDWVDTHQRIPKMIDSLFEKMGATRISRTGFVDVKGDLVGPWEDWSSELWSKLRESTGTTSEVRTSELQVAIEKPKFVTNLGGADMAYGTVKKNIDLGGGEIGLQKKHIEIELPEGQMYNTGNYCLTQFRAISQLTIA